MNRQFQYIVAFCSALTIAVHTVRTSIAHPGGVEAPTAAFPPIIPDNEFRALSELRYNGPAFEIVLTRVELQPFAGQSTPAPDGERHHFESQLRGEISINGSPAQPFSATGPVDTVAIGRCPTCDVGTWPTEMLQMFMQGSSFVGPFMMRESPTQQSTGLLSMADIGPTGPPSGPYHIDSFFDVFTELSVDGGATWIPFDNSLYGDYSDNGIVDAEDYVMWRESVGEEAFFLPNDNTGEAIGPAQYQLWRSHFGNFDPCGLAVCFSLGATETSLIQSVGLAESSTGEAVLPEPAMWLSSMFAGAGWCFQRRRAT